MTDYLYSVKKVVERLNLQPRYEMGSISGNKASYSHNDGNLIDACSITDVNLTEVVYRHRKHSTRNTRLEINHSQTRSDLRNKSNDVPRRESMSLYQLIKANQENAVRKNITERGIKAPDVKSMNVKSHLKGGHEMFEFNNLPIEQTDPTVLETIKPLMRTHRITQLPLISKAPIIVEPQSPEKEPHSAETVGTNGGVDKRRESTVKSPSDFEPVFAENTSNTRRKSSSTFHPLLSASKSVPLSPSTVTDETVTRRFGDFQLKVDTLRAELFAMRKTDQELARTLLNIYAEIQVLKVKSSCMNFSELLDEAYYDAELADELPDVCDAQQKYINRHLISRGVTSFNINSRRFSCS